MGQSLADGLIERVTDDLTKRLLDAIEGIVEASGAKDFLTGLFKKGGSGAAGGAAKAGATAAGSAGATAATTAGGAGAAAATTAATTAGGAGAAAGTTAATTAATTAGGTAATVAGAGLLATTGIIAAAVAVTALAVYAVKKYGQQKETDFSIGLVRDQSGNCNHKFAKDSKHIRR